MSDCSCFIAPAFPPTAPRRAFPPICNPRPRGLVEPPTGRPSRRLPEGVRCPPPLPTSSADARRLVLGAAIGFGVAEVRVFVESLRGAGYGGDVMMLDPLAGPRRRPLSQAPRRRRHAGVPDALVLALGACAALCDLSRLPQGARRALRPGDDVGRARRRVPEPSVRRHRQPEMPFLSRGRRAHHRLRSHQFALGARLLHRGRGRGAGAPSHQLQRHHHRRHRRDRDLSRAHGGEDRRHAAAHLPHHRPRLRPGRSTITSSISTPRSRASSRRTTATSPPWRWSRASSIRSMRAARIHGPDGRLYPICHQYDRFPDIRAAVEARYAK